LRVAFLGPARRQETRMVKAKRIRKTKAEVEQLRPEIVRLYDEEGVSFGLIGDRLGMSGENARKHYQSACVVPAKALYTGRDREIRLCMRLRQFQSQVEYARRKRGETEGTPDELRWHRELDKALARLATFEARLGLLELQEFTFHREVMKMSDREVGGALEAARRRIERDTSSQLLEVQRVETRQREEPACVKRSAPPAGPLVTSPPVELAPLSPPSVRVGMGGRLIEDAELLPREVEESSSGERDLDEVFAERPAPTYKPAPAQASMIRQPVAIESAADSSCPLPTPALSASPYSAPVGGPNWGGRLGQDN